MQKSLLIHNPRCSKSREAKAILDNLAINYEIIEYLKDGLKQKLLAHLPKLLGLNYKDMVRKKEPIYKDLKLSDKDHLTDLEWIQIFIKHPVLLERPIFIHEGKAVIARPPELVNSII
jgi:arsenate reductase